MFVTLKMVGYVKIRRQNTQMHDIIISNIYQQTQNKLCSDEQYEYTLVLSVESYENYTTLY